MRRLKGVTNTVGSVWIRHYQWNQNKGMHRAKTFSRHQFIIQTHVDNTFFPICFYISVHLSSGNSEIHVNRLHINMCQKQETNSLWMNHKKANENLTNLLVLNIGDNLINITIVLTLTFIANSCLRWSAIKCQEYDCWSNIK